MVASGGTSELHCEEWQKVTRELLSVWLTERGIAKLEEGETVLGDCLLDLASDLRRRLAIVSSQQQVQTAEDAMVDVVHRLIVSIDRDVGRAWFNHDAASATSWVEVAVMLADFRFVPWAHRARLCRRLKVLDPDRMEDVRNAWKEVSRRPTRGLVHRALTVCFGALLAGCSGDPITCDPPETATYQIVYHYIAGDCHYDRRSAQMVFVAGVLTDRIYEGCRTDHQMNASKCHSTSSFICAGGNDSFDLQWADDRSAATGTARIGYPSCTDTYDVTLARLSEPRSL